LRFVRMIASTSAWGKSETGLLAPAGMSEETDGENELLVG
jgi:hypothetical protein